ncbi:MAG: hypothetical protein ACKOQ3_11370 [Novosphingobium sp.]
MEQSPTPPPPVAAPAAPAAGSPALTPVHPRRWTPQRQQAFLQALHATRSVSAAADHAGMSRQSAYRLRTRRPELAALWAMAEAAGLGLPRSVRVAQGDRGRQVVTPGNR